jgi:hypothetical protein
MKNLMVLLGGILIGHLAQAEPIFGIRLTVRMVSKAGEWATVNYAGKRVRIPASTLHNASSTKPQEVWLSQSQYQTMKQEYLLAIH